MKFFVSVSDIYWIIYDIQGSKFLFNINLYSSLVIFLLYYFTHLPIYNIYINIFLNSKKPIIYI